MNPDHARTWRKIACFYGLTLLFTTPFYWLDMRAPGNLTLITGAMWSPGLAAFATQWLFGESIRALPWQWGSGREQVRAYLLPFVYAVPLYALVWVAGLGGFFDPVFMEAAAGEYGLTGLPVATQAGVYVLLSLTIGFIPKTARALGEEIGWRGFLVPELAKVTGPLGIGVISGLMWAAWHFPSILASDYNAGTPAWFSLPCFTAMVVASSFIAAWLTLRSRSLWPAVIFHGAHNTLVQLVLTPLTTDTGHTAWIIDEFGIGMVITTGLVALFLWRRYPVRLDA